MKRYFSFLLFIFVMGSGSAQELKILAQEFLKTLGPELQEKTLFTLNSEERFNFNYVPIARKGPTFHDFNEGQKQAALALLQASLSTAGYQKASEIMALEAILVVLENNTRKKPDGSPMRDILNYHFCIFGDPENNDFWGWRFEGHHISLNFVAEDGMIVASTPFFMGSNPGIAPSGEHKGKEVLKQETKLGFDLLNSLTKDQLAIARFSETAPMEIFTSNKRKAWHLDHKGISYATLSEDQKVLFMKLLNVYLSNYESHFSETFKSKIKKSGFEKLSFSWAGSLQEGKGHYYSIQGPMLLIEYDNTQNNANHVHTVVRDLTNDFGGDVLQEHYKTNHQQ